MNKFEYLEAILFINIFLIMFLLYGGFMVICVIIGEHIVFEICEFILLILVVLIKKVLNVKKIA